MEPVIPHRLRNYFEVHAYGDAVRIQCKNGHVEHGGAGEEHEILSRLFVQNPDCRFCRKLHGV